MLNKIFRIGKKTLTVTIIVLLLLMSTLPLTLGDVTPEEVSVTLNPGESHTVEKTVTNPPIPPETRLPAAGG